MIIGRLKLERYVEDFVWQTESPFGMQFNAAQDDSTNLSWAERIERGWSAVKEIVTVQPVILNGVNAWRLAKYSDCQSGVRDAKRSSLS